MAGCHQLLCDCEKGTLQRDDMTALVERTFARVFLHGDQVADQCGEVFQAFFGHKVKRPM